MGRYIDPNQPFDDDTVEFLESRGRHGEVVENRRRFPNGEASAADIHEGAGENPESASFDTDDRSGADYDVGGAPLPGRVLDVDTGRVIPLNERTETPEGLSFIDPETGEEIKDPNAFDPDIVEHVESIKNVDELKKRLKDEKVDFTGKTKREDLEDALIVALQDKRDGKVEETEDSSEFIDPANGDSSLDQATVETEASK